MKTPFPRRPEGGVEGSGEAQWDPVPEWGQLLATMRVVYSLFVDPLNCKSFHGFMQN